MHFTLLQSLFEVSLCGFRVSSYKAIAEGTALIVRENLDSIDTAW